MKKIFAVIASCFIDSCWENSQKELRITYTFRDSVLVIFFAVMVLSMGSLFLNYEVGVILLLLLESFSLISIRICCKNFCKKERWNVL